jgi:outer membrane protein assembly factor BamD (BamD/ComL family)
MMTSNQFEKFLVDAVAWIRTHQERFWAITGGSFLFILLVALMIHRRETESTEAWFQLGGIQGQLMQGKVDAVRKALDTWNERFGTTDAATYAKFMKADLLYRTTDYAQAAQVYADLAQSGQPDLLRPLALSAEASCEEMAGHIPQAISLGQSFLDRYPDHFMSGPRYIDQARLTEITGDAAGAAAIYDRFILLFPQSPWTDLAKARSQGLKARLQQVPAPAVAPAPSSLPFPNPKP